jgi:MEMO1 family protein
MIVFSCFVPHSPLLIPEVGQDKLTDLEQTTKAYKTLEHDLYTAKPDVIVIISPHTEGHENSFVINQQPNFIATFKDFGDLVTKLDFSNDTALGYKIKEAAETSLPIFLTATDKLDYGVGVPLYFLAQNLSNTKIVQIGYHGMKTEDYIKFGELLKEEINKYDKRVAIVASGDLSHRLSQDSPAGFSPQGQDFDDQIKNYLDKKEINKIIDLKPEFIEAAGECGYRSMLILLGAIKNMNFTPQQLSYESPFGIGYLVENFDFKN